MDIYLIRHGQSEENTKPEWDGDNTNSPLTPLGESQASAVGAWLARYVKLDRIYASTMRRAQQTAQAIAAHYPMELCFDDRLREVGNAYGDGKPFPDDDLPRYVLGVWGSLHPYKIITENGENWMQFRARVGSFIEELVEEVPNLPADFAIGVVCHGGVIEGVFEHVFQKGPVSTIIVQTNNTGITRLRYRIREQLPPWSLLYHNKTEHLAPEQIT